MIENILDEDCDQRTPRPRHRHGLDILNTMLGTPIRYLLKHHGAGWTPSATLPSIMACVLCEEVIVIAFSGHAAEHNSRSPDQRANTHDG